MLLGHCGADASYLRLAVKKAEPEAQIVAVEDRAELEEAVKQGADLILVNRELGWGFDDGSGVNLIRAMRRKLLSGPQCPTNATFLLMNC